MFDGKRESKCRPSAELAVDPDVSAMCFDQPLANRKANSSARNRALVASSVKFLEDPGSLVRGNSSTVVSNRQFDRVMNESSRKCHIGAIGRKLEGVLA